MKILVLIYLIIVANICIGYAQNFKNISEGISNCQLKEGIRKITKEEYYQSIRMKIYETGKLFFINNSDTLFFLETYVPEEGSFYGKIWNNHNNSMDYSYRFGQLDFNIDKVFTDYTCKLLRKWDINAIRKEEKQNSTMFNPLLIFGSRVIKQGANYRFDCLSFNEFFLLERDR
jgi:hypothetical protein